MKYFIGADLGTSSLKLLLTDAEGKIINSVSREYPLSFPHPGWSEQNPEDWWTALADGIPELISGTDACDIAAIGVGGQMHGLVTLDAHDRVIRPAILWNDGRTDAETDYLNNEIGRETLSRQTGNIAFAGFTAPKILWMRNNEKENFDRICKIMLPKDYINYRLTGVHCTDYSDASGMLLLDVKNKKWSEPMMKICGIKEEQLPKLYESYETVGHLTASAASALGLDEKTIVVAGAGDNAAAAVGTGTVSAGSCNISLGTSGTVFIPSDEFHVDSFNALHSFCHADGGYHLMGCILSAASCSKWFFEEILGTDNYAAEESAVTDDMLGRGHVYFLPYLMGERSPINDTDARGCFIGMRMDTKRADMVQAVLEGVSFAIKDCLEIASAQSIDIGASCLCGGGAKSALWQKIICNILNIPIKLVQTEQGPGYGAAMLAMVGAGVYPTVADCAASIVRLKKTILPDPEIAARYADRYAKFREIYPSVKTLFRKLK